MEYLIVFAVGWTLGSLVTLFRDYIRKVINRPKVSGQPTVAFRPVGDQHLGAMVQDDEVGMEPDDVQEKRKKEELEIGFYS